MKEMGVRKVMLMIAQKMEIAVLKVGLVMDGQIVKIRHMNVI